MRGLRLGLMLFVLFYLAPLGVAALRHQFVGVGADWWQADRGSIGLLPPAATHAPAVVRIFAAPTVRWRGIFAVHTWIVVKPEGADRYTRYDYTAWGEPIRVNGFTPDGRWFGRAPEVVFAADGEAAAALIPRMQETVASYQWRHLGDYRVWPGPNSNTFVAAILSSVPEAHAVLPPTAIGKDFPHDGRWLRPTPSRTGFSLTLGGIFVVTLGWVEGIELGVLGAVSGIDIRRPALKLPGLGRIGMPATG